MNRSTLSVALVSALLPPPGIDLGDYGWYRYPPHWCGYPYAYS